MPKNQKTARMEVQVDAMPTPPPPPPSPCTMHRRNHRAFKDLLAQPTLTLAHHESPPSGLFDILPDDAMAHIFAALYGIEIPSERYTDFKNRARRKPNARALLRLAGSCKRLHRVFATQCKPCTSSWKRASRRRFCPPIPTRTLPLRGKCRPSSTPRRSSRRSCASTHPAAALRPRRVLRRALRTRSPPFSPPPTSAR